MTIQLEPAGWLIHLGVSGGDSLVRRFTSFWRTECGGPEECPSAPVSQHGEVWIGATSLLHLTSGLSCWPPPCHSDYTNLRCPLLLLYSATVWCPLLLAPVAIGWFLHCPESAHSAVLQLRAEGRLMLTDAFTSFHILLWWPKIQTRWRELCAVV